MSSNKTCIVGLGYIGLPTAAVIALSKQHVIGLETNSSIVNTVNKGQIHIKERGLQEAVSKAVESKYLKATTIVEPADIFVIAVPTPFKNNNHEPDLSYIRSVAGMISAVLKPGDLVILESTSPVGTTELLREWLSAARGDLQFCGEGVNNADIYIAYCPERVLPGNTLYELVKNDRVIGGLCEESNKLAESFYKTFVEGECFKTNARTAEMTKLTENSFRDVNIALANELALISKNLNINVWELIDLANRHPRVNILNPGAGVGGHCIAVDPWFIVDKNPEALLIKQSRLINDRKPLEIVEDIKELCSNQGDIVINKIGLFGLSYKPDIDDLRESPSLEIALNLAEIYPEKVYAIEPNLPENEDIINNTISLISYDEAFSECDLIVILVPHTEFKEIFSTYTTKAQILDYCGLLHKKDSF